MNPWQWSTFIQFMMKIKGFELAACHFWPTFSRIESVSFQVLLWPLPATEALPPCQDFHGWNCIPITPQKACLRIQFILDNFFLKNFLRHLHCCSYKPTHTHSRTHQPVVLWTTCTPSRPARVIPASTKVAVWEDRLSVDHGQPKALSLIGSAMEEA